MGDYIPKLGLEQWNKIDKMLQAGSNGVQVANNYGLSIEQLYEECRQVKGMEFCTYLQKQWEIGNIIVNTKLFQKAVVSGEVKALIYLHKVRTGNNVVEPDQKLFNQCIDPSDNPNIINPINIEQDGKEENNEQVK